MQMAGEQMIAAPRRKVWAALNDPEVLRQAIDGCESFERTSPDSFAVRVTTRIGPVGLGFGGAVTLADVDPPNGYTLIGEGTGSGAGFARGLARVSLSDVAGSATRLSYQVEAEVGGKLAQIGGRLIDQAARKQADSFFARFAAIVAEDGLAGKPPSAEDAGLARGPTWLAAAVMILAALVLGFLAGRL
jgi:carbon monoxide dehydrogenase subunit G